MSATAWPVVVSGLPSEVGEVDTVLSQVVNACGWVHRGWERNAVPGAPLGSTETRENGPPEVARHGFVEFVTLCGARRCLEAVDGLVLTVGATGGAALRAAAPRPTREALGGWATGDTGLKSAVMAAEDEARAIATAGDTLPGLLRVVGNRDAPQATQGWASQVDHDTGTFLDSVFPGHGGGEVATAVAEAGAAPEADSGPMGGAGDGVDDAALLKAIPLDPAVLYARPVEWDALLRGGGQEEALDKVASWAATKAEKLGMAGVAGMAGVSKPMTREMAEAIGMLVGQRLRERTPPHVLIQTLRSEFPAVGEPHVDALVASVWRVLVFEAIKAARGTPDVRI